MPGWLKYTLFGLGFAGNRSGLAWLWIGVVGRRLKAALGTPRLNAVISVLFVCLTIPILIFILLYNYHTNASSIAATLRANVAKTNQASIENTENFIQPIAGALRLLAATAAVDPNFFRTEPSRDFLYRTLTVAPQIDAAYVSFEDGYHRVVTRIDDDRRRSDPLIPPSANWHSSYIDDFSAGLNRARHRTFFDVWPHVVGRYSAPSTLDIRTLAGIRGREGIPIADHYRDHDQSRHRISDHFLAISDRAQRRIHRRRQRQYHARYPVALPGASPHQSEQHDDHRRSQRWADHHALRHEKRRASPNGRSIAAGAARYHRR